MPTLILTPRFTDDAQALWRAAQRLGWNVERLSSWRVPDELKIISEPVLYVEGLFGDLIAGEFGISLSQPPLDWLPSLPIEYRKREVFLTTLASARMIKQPMFMKPPNDKCFPAGIYTGGDLPLEFDEAAPVLVSEVVSWEKEFRCFVLDRQVRTMSIYLRNGIPQREFDFTAEEDELDDARAFAERLLFDHRVTLPRAAVIDVGVIQDRGWAVIEQNAAWGSGIYGCNPSEVLEVIRYANERPHP
ncbi:ATP-grasp domain-containing protein [bacterium]|nr:ATP-grasp domain-containing protein [bacterium]